jgi:hypothetical protein
MLRLRYAVLDEYSVLILSLRERPWSGRVIWEWESLLGSVAFTGVQGSWQRLANTSIWRGLCTGMVLLYY